MRKTKAIPVGDLATPSEQPPSDDEMIGRLIGGKYQILSLVGQGGFGAVYRAEQQPVGRIVALKVIKGNAQDDAELRARFLREAKSVARLQSQHIVTLFDYGEEPDGLLYGVFEFVHGRSLDRVIKEDGALSVPTAVTFAIEVLEALSAAHDQGIVHRDLKPANIMISKGSWGTEQAQVLDFGIAKVVDHEDDASQTVATRQGLILGTPHYMAPEQAHATDIDARTDLYAMGTLIYAMLCGRPPFEGKSAYSILEAHVTKPVEDVLALMPTAVPEGVRAVIGKAMAKHPDDRWPSARAMAEALAPFVGELGQTQGLSATSDRLRRPSISIRIPTTETTTQVETRPAGGRGWMIAVVLLVLLGIGGGAAWFLTRGEGPVTPPDDPEAGKVKITVGGDPGKEADDPGKGAVGGSEDDAQIAVTPDAAVPDAAIADAAVADAATPDAAKPDAAAEAAKPAVTPKPPVRRNTQRRRATRTRNPGRKPEIKLDEF